MLTDLRIDSGPKFYESVGL